MNVTFLELKTKKQQNHQKKTKNKYKSNEKILIILKTWEIRADLGISARQKWSARSHMEDKKKMTKKVSIYRKYACIVHVTAMSVRQDNNKIKQQRWQKPELFRQSKRSVTWQNEDEIFMRYSSHTKKNNINSSLLSSAII